jgi:hypothetical protein
MGPSLAVAVNATTNWFRSGSAFAVREATTSNVTRTRTRQGSARNLKKEASKT